MEAAIVSRESIGGFKRGTQMSSIIICMYRSEVLIYRRQRSYYVQVSFSLCRYYCYDGAACTLLHPYSMAIFNAPPISTKAQQCGRVMEVQKYQDVPTSQTRIS